MHEYFVYFSDAHLKAFYSEMLYCNFVFISIAETNEKGHDLESSASHA